MKLFSYGNQCTQKNQSKGSFKKCPVCIRASPAHTSSLAHSLPSTGDTELKFRRFANLSICADSSYAGSFGHIL
jgi:hypothetical protein